MEDILAQLVLGMLDLGKEQFGTDQKNKRPSDDGRALFQPHGNMMSSVNAVTASE